MSNLDVYGIACSLLVVALVLSISYARNQARKDIEMMKSSKTRSLQFEYIPRKTRRFNVLKLEELRAMDPFAFERYVAKILQLHGFSDAYGTQEGGDGGKDVIFTIDGKLYYSECKRFGANHSVGRPIVQKLVGSALADNAIPYAIFTTGRFTKEAIEEAKKTGKLIKIHELDMSEWFSFKVMQEEHTKAIVILDEKDDVVLGEHILSDQADQLINYFAICCQLQLKVSDLKEIVYTFPSVLHDTTSMF